MDQYLLEITTNFFRIDKKTGKLLVNEPNLDRDPPSSDRLTFQVQALKCIDSIQKGFFIYSCRKLKVTLFYSSSCTFRYLHVKQEMAILKAKQVDPSVLL